MLSKRKRGGLHHHKLAPYSRRAITWFCKGSAELAWRFGSFFAFGGGNLELPFPATSFCDMKDNPRGPGSLNGAAYRLGETRPHLYLIGMEAPHRWGGKTPPAENQGNGGNLASWNGLSRPKKLKAQRYLPTVNRFPLKDKESLDREAEKCWLNWGRAHFRQPESVMPYLVFERR